MKLHRAALAAVAAAAIGGGTLAPGAFAGEGDECPPGTNNPEYCEHHHHHHHHHHHRHHGDNGDHRRVGAGSG